MDSGEPDRAGLEREFPGWHITDAFLPGGLVRARHRSTPGLSVEGEDWLDLRDQLRAAEARQP